MLRLFFGLYSLSLTADWWSVFTGDNLKYPVLWGKSTTLAAKTITAVKRHKPHYVPSGTYDEYIDLYDSVIDPQAAEFFAQFTNQAGITTPYPITSLSGVVHNTVEVDGELGEWLQTPTSMLSQVFPPTGDPAFLEQFWVVNETIENDPSLSIAGYVSFAGAVKSGASYGFANDPCVVPYHATDDDIRIMWKVPAGVVSKVVIYRAPVVESAYPQKLLPWPQWGNWRLVHNHLPIAEIDPDVVISGVVFSDAATLVNGHYVGHGLVSGMQVSISGTTNWDGDWVVTRVNDDDFTLDTAVWSAGADNTGDVKWWNTTNNVSVTAHYAHEATFSTPAPTLTNWCAFKPLNNAIARMNIAFQSRIDSNYKVLLINTDTMTYWKGYLTRLSPCFEVGVGVTDDKAAQFSIAVTEQGYCTHDALTAPNTSTNFIATTRTL